MILKNVTAEFSPRVVEEIHRRDRNKRENEALALSNLMVFLSSGESIFQHLQLHSHEKPLPQAHSKKLWEINNSCVTEQDYVSGDCG